MSSEALQPDIDSVLMPPPPKRLRDDAEPPNLARDVGFSLMSSEQHSMGSQQATVATENDDFSSMMHTGETIDLSSLPDTINFVTPPKAEDSLDSENRDAANLSETDSMQSERSTVIGENLSVSSEIQDQRHQDGMPEMTTTRFSDIIGHASVKLRIDEMLLPLALPSALADSILTGVRSLPACLLLYGPPGCGKVCVSVVE